MFCSVFRGWWAPSRHCRPVQPIAIIKLQAISGETNRQQSIKQIQLPRAHFGCISAATKQRSPRSILCWAMYSNTIPPRVRQNNLRDDKRDALECVLFSFHSRAHRETAIHNLCALYIRNTHACCVHKPSMLGVGELRKVEGRFHKTYTNMFAHTCVSRSHGCERLAPPFGDWEAGSECT